LRPFSPIAAGYCLALGSRDAFAGTTANSLVVAPNSEFFRAVDHHNADHLDEISGRLVDDVHAGSRGVNKTVGCRAWARTAQTNDGNIHSASLD
jgi:hypothetical protein